MEYKSDIDDDEEGKLSHEKGITCNIMRGGPH